LSNPYNAPNADLGQVADVDAQYDPSVFTLSGRIGRVRYLAYSFVTGIVGLFAIGILAGITAAISPKLMLVVVAVFGLLYMATGFIFARRRFNDMNYSGWFSLLMLIPFVSFFISLWLLFGPGDEQANDFGLPPSKNTTGVIIAAWSVPVLIAMIGVLAAIAMPAYQSYVERAQAAQIQSQPPASALPGSQY